ncbi:zinc finger protein GIS2-like [Lathyrus oleraceus]|uniref:zinc finger protein GIS2-like n=1 Tax=Pisum sativum TaxID=3888 RepID=UPI0021D16F9A|nr:zinc finger protein GIS2-like [Pisum sativum]
MCWRASKGRKTSYYSRSHVHEAVIFEPAAVAYAAQSKGKCRDMSQVQCFSCKQFGHIARNCSKKICNYCNQQGHIISECPTRPPRPTQCSVQAFHATTNYAVGPSNGSASNNCVIQPGLIQ